ncbi:MAG: colanic acid biosynthesis glycosyltransferase WcaL [Rhodospirillaceae bacterium]|nr:colanic acid biosynthesis glycosyltransferase WcaL [Rhodospirillaceae bacterium]
MSSVAVILKGYPRLSETFIAQEILGLEEAEIDIQIYSLRKPTDKTSHPIHQEIRAPVVYLPEYLYKEPVRLWRAWKYVRALQSYRKVYSLWINDLKRDFTPNRVRRFGQAVVLAAEIPTQISHLYAHFLHTPASVTRYAAQLLGISWSVSAHAVDIWTTPDWEKREKLDDCSWATTCSDIASKHLKELAANPEQVSLIYHGLDLTRFSKPAKAKSPRNGSSKSDPIRLLTVGRAVEKKGHDIVIAALSALPPSLNWRWTHIGGGLLVKKLKKQAASAGISEKIDWRGSLPQNEVMEAYNSADLFVLANRVAKNGDQDGLPNVLMEAQSQELACIASNVAAVPELIQDDINGSLVTADEPLALAEKIYELAELPEKRIQMGKRGREIIEARFSHTAGIKALVKKFHLEPGKSAQIKANSPER